MLLSIIIPVYNVEAYLAECLDSVYSQIVDGCEVIAVNDGSTDNSREILSEYKIKYPELIIIDQENRGLSGARNTGMTHACGKYLYFLDSDDYLLPNAIKNIIHSINDTDDDVIGFNALANGDNVYIPSFHVSDVPKTGIDFYVDFYTENGFYPYCNVPVYVYQKAFLDSQNLTFKVGLYHEDIHFSMYVFFFAKKMKGYNIPVFNYRQHRDGSICTNVKLKNLMDKSIICRELDIFYRAQKFQNVYFYNTIFHTYLYTILQGVNNGYYAQRKQFFNKEDIAIMKKGIMNKYELKLWILARVDTKLMVKYSENQINKYIRRLINLTFSLFFSIPNKKQKQ